MRQGCYEGCIHYKEVKLDEMKDKYAFRCTAQRVYMKAEEAKRRCRFYEGPYRVIIRTIEDFFE